MMFRAGPHHISSHWHRVYVRQYDDEYMRWCGKHVSNGHWDQHTENNSVVYLFEQQEDAMMFRLWLKRMQYDILH